MSTEGSVASHSRNLALRSPEVAAVKAPPVDWSRAARLRGLEGEVTVKTLKLGLCPYGIGVVIGRSCTELGTADNNPVFSPGFRQTCCTGMIRAHSLAIYRTCNDLYAREIHLLRLIDMT